jgi:hypothetical protein
VALLGAVRDLQSGAMALWAECYDLMEAIGDERCDWNFDSDMEGVEVMLRQFARNRDGRSRMRH